MIITESNYFSPEAEMEYVGSTQYRGFAGTTGKRGCEAQTMAKIKGQWEQEKTAALLVGSYVDAHFSSTLATFQAKNPEIYTNKSTLRSEYRQAEQMIARVERDPYFMQTLAGGSQKILTAEFAGLKWKVKIDSYHENVAIVDLKTSKSITESYWVKDLGRISMVEYWGYDIQMAIYQKACEIDNGKQLPVLLAIVSKEKVPDIEVVGIDQRRLDSIIKTIELAAPRIIALKNGEAEPDRCEVCDYCKETKKLTKPIHYSEIVKKI